MSKTILPNGFSQTAIGTKTVRIGWDGALNAVSATAKLSLGFLPANCVVKAIRGTLVTAEGTAGNLLVISTTDGGSTNTTLLTIDANGTAGTRTAVPANVDATAAVPTIGCVLDTGTTPLELMLMGSALLNGARAVIDIEAYFGPTVGDDGTAFLSL
jgi:hypothetical protein